MRNLILIFLIFSQSISFAQKEKSLEFSLYDNYLGKGFGIGLNRESSKSIIGVNLNTSIFFDNFYSSSDWKNIEKVNADGFYWKGHSIEIETFSASRFYNLLGGNFYFKRKLGEYHKQNALWLGVSTDIAVTSAELLNYGGSIYNADFSIRNDTLRFYPNILTSQLFFTLSGVFRINNKIKLVNEMGYGAGVIWSSQGERAQRIVRGFYPDNLIDIYSLEFTPLFKCSLLYTIGKNEN